LTPSTDPNRVLDVIVDITDELRAQHHVRALGIGAAGFVDSSQSTVVFSPHLAWRHEPCVIRLPGAHDCRFWLITTRTPRAGQNGDSAPYKTNRTSFW